MEQNIEDDKFPKSGWKDGADIEYPVVQKAKPKMSWINLVHVVSNAVVSG